MLTLEAKDPRRLFEGNALIRRLIRIGVLDESIVTPGVYISYLQRDLPTVSLTGSSGSGSGVTSASGNFALNDFSVKTSAWRLVAAKNLLVETRRQAYRWQVGRHFAPPGWVPTWVLREPWAGGAAGDRRLRDLREEGVDMAGDEQAHPHGLSSLLVAPDFSARVATHCRGDRLRRR